MKSIDLASVDLNLWVAFEALFEERSVTAAAQRLYLGQPAMSAALGRLRSLFEDELFIRIGREMQPTAKALEIAPGILATLQQIRQTLQTRQTFDPATSDRRVAIASSDYISCIVMPKFLAFCQQFAPHLNLRLIGFEKDDVGDLLEQGVIDLALGVFPTPPRQSICEPLFQERFVGIARQGHPAIAQLPLSIATFASLAHVLVTLRRDATGYLDQVLAARGLTRRIALTTPYMLVIPSLVTTTDLIASVPSRIATYWSKRYSLEIFDLPIETDPWTVSMLWSKLVDQDSAHLWLRQTLMQILETSISS